MINEQLVNFYRPANSSERGGNVPASALRYAILANDAFPGPALNAVVGQVVRVVVVNALMSDEVSIHWHGIHQVGALGEEQQ